MKALVYIATAAALLLGPRTGEARVSDRSVQRVVARAERLQAEPATGPRMRDQGWHRASRLITHYLYGGAGIGRFSVEQLAALTKPLPFRHVRDAWFRYVDARKIALDLEPGHRTLRQITEVLKQGDARRQALGQTFQSVVDANPPFRLARSIAPQERALYAGEGIGRLSAGKLMASVKSLAPPVGADALLDHVGARYDRLMLEPGHRTLRQLATFAGEQARATGSRRYEGAACYINSLAGALIYPRE